MVLHALEQGLDGLLAEVVGGVLVGQGVGLVDEEHTTQGLLDDLVSLDGGLAYKSGHQSGPVHLHQLALGQYPDGVVDLGQQTGHRGFASARIAHKDQV